MNKISTIVLGLMLATTAQAKDVSTVDELFEAMQNGDDVVLTDDITTNGETYRQPVNSKVIDGNGKTIKGGEEDAMFIRNMGGEIDEIKNITFDGFNNKIFYRVDENGNFTTKDENGNKLENDDNLGAAITTIGKVGKIDGTFTNNTAYHGAAIFNGSGGEIGSINGTFTGNQSKNFSDKAYTEASGAAIHNQGHIGNITGVFENNTAEAAGTIWNYGNIDNITATFKNNHRSAVGGNHGVVNITNSYFYQNDTTGRLYYWIDENGVERSTNHGQSGAGVVWWGGQTYNISDTKFEENHADWKGGAIAGWNGGKLTVEDSLFTKNSAGEEGGAIYQTGGTGSVKGSTFTDNSGRTGGAIYNTTTFNVENSNFENNRDTVSWSKGGGAIANGGTMTIANSEIKANRSNSYGGGISNFGGNLTFSDNKIINNNASWYGGGIDVSAGKANINRALVENNISNNGGAGSVRTGTLEIDSTEIVDNKSRSNGGAFYVGSISKEVTTGEGDNKVTETVTTEGNLIVKDSLIDGNKSEGNGGAVYVADGTATFINTDIVNNESGVSVSVPVSESVTLSPQDNPADDNAAIYALSDVNFVADGQDMLIADNNNSTNALGVWAQDTTLTFDTKNGGRLLVDDRVDGLNYDVTISGDTTDYSSLDATSKGYVDFSDGISNVNTLKFAEGGMLHLSNGEFMTVGNIKGENGALWLDAEMDAATNTLTNGGINVYADVEGNTNVVVNFLKDDTTSAPTDVVSPFVWAENDDLTTDAGFNVARVIGSPYMWESKYNINGDETGSVWYLGVKQQQTPDEPDEPDVPDVPDTPVNPDEPDEPDVPDVPDTPVNPDEPDEPDVPDTPVNPDKPDEPNVPGEPSKPNLPVYAPEMSAYIGLQYAAVEQNRAIATGVVNGLNVFDSRLSSLSCNGRNRKCPRNNLWIHTGLEGANIDAPTEMDAEIRSVTAGADLYRSPYTRAGIFGTYRDGEYEFSGKGDYYAVTGSDINTDSYLGGAYYKYDRNNWALFATLFGGKQDMDITTKDMYVDVSTDAMQYGFSAELARRYVISRHLDVEPSLGIYYTMLDIDDFSDEYGKSVEFDVLHYWEAELGVKLNYLGCCNGCSNRMYVKPSIVRTFSSGGKTKITGLDNVKSYKDRTLGRLELGGEFGITSRLSGYTSGGYTFGTDYETYDILMGLNYKL